MSKQRITAASKRTKKQERREEERHQELKRQQRRRNTLIIVPVAVVVVLAILGGIIYLTTGSHSASGSQSAQTNTTASNSAFAPVNTVSCDNGEHGDFHHHIHLSMHIDSQAVVIPQNIGINNGALNPCLYWLHTHDTSGVIHIEAPAQRTYTIGDFLDVWYQRFAQLGYPSQLGLTSGWQVYVNGQIYTGNFRNIPMEDHTLVTMAYNSPGVKPETTYNWNGL
jgi:hypothetical protein